jgi:hypothetical protein
MSGTTRRFVVLVASAAVSLTGMAGAALADQPTPYASGSVITALPAKAALVGNQSPAQFVTVTLGVPGGLDCVTDLTARVAGDHDAVTVSTPPDCTVSGFASWKVTAGPFTEKREAVVKFTTRKSDHGKRTVATLHVKVNPMVKPAKPVPYASGAEIATFPAKAVLIGNQSPAQFIVAKVAIPTGLACADMTTRLGGHRDAVTVSAAPDCAAAGFARWTVTASAITHKRHAVVKFIATSPADGEKTVSTLNVKVNPTAKPAKGNGQG